MAAVQLPTEWAPEELAKAQEEDKVLHRVRYYLRLGRQPSDRELPAVRGYCRKDQIRDTDGLLQIRYSKGRETVNQLLVPEVLIPQILQQAHDKAGHFGADKTLQLIRRHFYWSTLHKDVGVWCRTCTKCQERKHPPTHARAPLQYFPIAAEPG